MVWFWALVAPALLMAAAALAGERRKLCWVRETLQDLGREERYWPPATVIVPVKGPEEGLAQNLAALADLDYPDYELLIAVRAPEDLPAGVRPGRSRIVVAGTGPPDTGEKVHNLLAAVRSARPESQILAFADSDAHANRNWLRALAAALDTPEAAASTGYRWHTPPGGGFWPLMRSVWDGVALGMMRPGGAAFAWGGAMAIRRADFDRLRIAQCWRGAVSDDYALTSAVQDARKRIAFAPGALSADSSTITGRAFLAWSRRQLVLTRVFRPKLWAITLAAHILYCASMAACALALIRGYWPALPALGFQLAAGMWKGRNRNRLAVLAVEGAARWSRRYGWVHTWWTPLATWVWLYVLVASAKGRRIRWRGRDYVLRPAPPRPPCGTSEQ